MENNKGQSMKRHIVFQVDISGRTNINSFQVRRDAEGYHVGKNGTEFSRWWTTDSYDDAMTSALRKASQDVAERIQFEAEISIRRVIEVIFNYVSGKLTIYHMQAEQNVSRPYPYAMPEFLVWIDEEN